MCTAVSINDNGHYSDYDFKNYNDNFNKKKQNGKKSY